MSDGSTAPDDATGQATPFSDLEGRVRDALTTTGDGIGIVLAVSGGRDSMALLHAAARVAPERVRVVATFDHGTGAHAAAASALVVARAAHYGLHARTGRAAGTIRPTEADWRRARWQFLRAAATEYGGAVATAHNRDDQLETVAMRILRHAGARGLAGLDTDAGIIRPWLGVSRADVARYAAAHELPYLDDPSNVSRVHLRNRVRLDLLPALRRVRPGLDDALLSIARSAAWWRRDVEHFVAQHHPLVREGNGVSVAAAGLVRYDAESLAVVWPAVAARAGVTLDRRGTARLVAFTTRGKVGGVIQVSGGIEIQRSPTCFVLRFDAGARTVRPRRQPSSARPPGDQERASHR